MIQKVSWPTEREKKCQFRSIHFPCLLFFFSFDTQNNEKINIINSVINEISYHTYFFQASRQSPFVFKSTIFHIRTNVHRPTIVANRSICYKNAIYHFRSKDNIKESKFIFLLILRLKVATILLASVLKRGLLSIFKTSIHTSNFKQSNFNLLLRI